VALDHWTQPSYEPPVMPIRPVDQGCVPIHWLMEDAATAEISRVQVWQWLRHGALLETGSPVTIELVRRCLHEELRTIEREVGEPRFQTGRYAEAGALFRDLATAPECGEFMTIPAYQLLD
jgi:malate synthase